MMIGTLDMTHNIQEWYEMGAFLAKRRKKFYAAGGTLDIIHSYDNLPILGDIPDTDDPIAIKGYESIKAALGVLSAPEDLKLFVAYVDGNLVGAANVLYEEDNNTIWHMGTLRTVPGIGSSMVLHIAEKAKERGVGIGSLGTSEPSRWFWDHITDGDEFASKEHVYHGILGSQSI